ncbi:MAG: hypothetical protein EA401_10390 [Planctomycetota bacterium]|nr:MAG: hypothetical protein EA401_10390 [Planctomycetota bacterium]
MGLGQGDAKLAMGKECPLRGICFSCKSALFRAVLQADPEIGAPPGGASFTPPGGLSDPELLPWLGRSH